MLQPAVKLFPAATNLIGYGGPMLADELLAWDAGLKARAVNPGTSADLTVATLFAHRLGSILPPARNSD